MARTLSDLNRWVAAASCLWLFLDYDGTLADFSATPDLVEVQPEVVSLIQNLSANPRMRVAVISGRKLQAVRELLPVTGVFLAGVYGVEIQTPAGELIRRADYERIRPFLEGLKPRWEKLVGRQAGFFLEDKDWSLALHASTLGAALAEGILSAAWQAAEMDLPTGIFRWFIDNKFLEIAPLQAHKGEAVTYLLNHFPNPDARLIYIGDDDKDEEAFDTVHASGGLTILVSSNADSVPSSAADYILKTPQHVRRWLKNLLRQGHTSRFVL